MTQIYCRPYRFEIDIRTCKERLLVINKEHEKGGVKCLNKDQKKCFNCQGGEVEAVSKPASESVKTIIVDPVFKDCGYKKSEVDRFYPRIELCSRCYQKAYRKPLKDSEVKS